MINKSLRELPGQRYQTVKGMVEDLQHFSHKEKKQKFLWQLKQGICVFFFLGFAGFLYQALEYWQWGVSFEDNFPLLVAMVFLMLFTMWRGCILSNPGKRSCYRIEKNIWKTDKQGIGLFLLLFAIGIWGMEIGVQAKESKDTLPVIVYDESGHKMLWQDNKVNILNGVFRSELPKECFEPGNEYNITITLEDKHAKKIMIRQFEVKTVKSSIEN